MLAEIARGYYEPMRSEGHFFDFEDGMEDALRLMCEEKLEDRPERWYAVPSWTPVHFICHITDRTNNREGQGRADFWQEAFVRALDSLE